MSEIIYRWEWRAFGATLAEADRFFQGAEPLGEPVETTETYLLGPEDHNVKIRFDLLDIKILRDTNEVGLQLWAPVMKAEFPLGSAELVEVFSLWGVGAPSLHRDAYTREQFLAELISPDPALVVADVFKRRTRYSIDGCMSEMTTLSVGDRSVRTTAVESEDPGSVVEAVEKLGLTGHVNTSYNVGLRSLLGLSPVRYGVVDVGTNSVKFHIGEQSTDGSWVRFADRAEVTRLGEGLDEMGGIQPVPLERTIASIGGMVEEARAANVLGITGVGTAALRLAGNAAEVIEEIRSRTGLAVRVVSGEEESRLAYLAVSAGVGLGQGDLVVFDTGGGSTQFTFGSRDEVGERFSVNVGAVSYTERFGLDQAVDDDTLENARGALRDDLGSLDGRSSPDALVGMGGAMTNLTAVSLALDPYDPDAVQGASVTRQEVERQIAMYRDMGPEDRRRIVGLQDNRAPVILAGALIVSTVLEKLGKESLIVSDRGLRHGLIREHFGFFTVP